MWLYNMNSRWTKRFALLPKRLDNGEFVMFKHYYTYETYTENPYNGARGYVVYSNVSRDEYLIKVLKK